MTVDSRPESIARVLAEGMIQAPVREPFYIRDITGMNASPNPSEIEDSEALLLQNFIPYPNWGLRKVPSWTLFATLEGTTETILRMANIFIADTAYLICALSDGSMVAVDLSDGTPTTIGDSGDFPTDPPPAFSQWEQTYLLIVDTDNGYQKWDPSGGLAVIDANVKGTGIEVFLDQVWIINGENLVFTGPNTYNDFTTPNGGGVAINTYATLRGGYTAIRASATLLYLFGKDNIYVIPSVQIQPDGSSFFQVEDLHADVGGLFPDTVQVLSNTVFVMDETGLWVISGYEANRISFKIDAYLSNRIDTFTPIGSVLTIWGIHLYGILVYLTNPITQADEYWMFCINPDYGLDLKAASWFVINFGFTAWTYIARNFTTETLPFNFAANGLDIVEMFDTESTNGITTLIVTKNYHFNLPDYDKKVMRFGMVVSANATLLFSVSITGQTQTWKTQLNAPRAPFEWHNDKGEEMTWENDNGDDIKWIGFVGENFNWTRANGRGKNISLQITETSDELYTLGPIALDIERRVRW